LSLWFFFLGLIWLFSGYRVERPSGRRLLWGLIFFAILWLAFGLLGQWVWAPWFLTPARLLLWLPLAVGFLPWLLAVGYAQQGATILRRIGWWALQCAILVPAILSLVFLVPGLYFLALVVGIIPAIIAIMAVVGTAVDDAWAYALGSALYFSWLILSVFPLAQ
jgi:hypothetical protein